MINVAAIRMKQFGVQFYQASLTAGDIDKLVRFEVLNYGQSAQPPVRGGKKKTLTLEVAPRVAPILLLIRAAAAGDPEVAILLDEIDARRLHRMTDNARRLGRAGHLRPGITVARAADVLWTYSSQELYELLVLRRGWPLARYGRFIADAMIDALL